MIKKYSQIQSKLPVLKKAPLEISRGVTNLSVFLSPVNSPEIQAIAGKEKVQKKLQFKEYTIVVTVSEYGSWRYLILRENKIVSAIQGVSKGDVNVLANIYTLPEYRKQGFATVLWGQAHKDMPNLTVSNLLTEDGAKFFRLASFVRTLAKESIDLDPKYFAIVDENFWDLI